MTQASDDGSALDRARGAAGRGAWAEAYAAYLEAREADGLGPAELADFAGVAYAAGHLDVAIETWERLHADLARLGEDNGAAGAAVRVAMHLLFDTALMAPVRGWLRRAERLLDPAEVTGAHAWFAVVRAFERLLSGDLDAARTWAARAVEAGTATDPAAAAIGRVAQARLVILGGDVERGLGLLDDAGTAAMSGDLDALSTGVVYCELVCALQGLAQYDLAEQWTEAMERWARTNAVGSLHGRCRVHRAEIMRLRGRHANAEQQVLLACEELRPYVRRELGWPLTELGRIRLRRGDLTGAEDALLAAHRLGWDPEPGLSLVRLAGGDVDAAAAAIREALARPLPVPSKELPPTSGLRRAPLLDAQVRIAVAGGDLETARIAARELDEVAVRFESTALAASACRARGEVLLAGGDAAAASESFAEAALAWSEVGAPYETAECRLRLADAQQALGNRRAEALEREAARTELERIAHEPAAEASQPATAERTTVEQTTAGRTTPERATVEPAAIEPAAIEPDTFVREGDHWKVVLDGRRVSVRDSKGMHHLARLLAAPGREFHVLDLVAADSDDPAVAAVLLGAGDAGPLLDDRAKQAYRRRLAEIEEDIEEAGAGHDTARQEQAALERDFLIGELARAVGLGGRDRHAGAASERARAAVTQAVRKAIGRLRDASPPLGDHLDRTIRTGTYCAYAPDPRFPSPWAT
ncbi:transcriptional regulator [Streptomyces sp. NBC_00249]|uniref:transcriptional regulator n=1 Tax=Streptomyces sp. NBC_00249 TaxID=2975690 RepID=UPI0022562DAA|nr:transcriptional regulator [Streptomyces sp. NBC_00249]MCX5192475.1 transcriptional regulator [Streptomyces sp. NBC_00249]